jgi:hypothetical protein
MFFTLRRKLMTLRRISASPDEIRLFVLSRFPSISPTSYWLRWLYPAWWKHIIHGLTMDLRGGTPERKNDRSSRFLLRVPNAAGIGDQIVTSWSEAYMLARQYDLTFVHHPFIRSPHDNSDWESFLGFGVGEMEAEQVLTNNDLKTVWLPPISLADQKNISLVGGIINQVYPDSNILFRLASKIYFKTDLDQSKIMPAVYSTKYEAARCKLPLDANFDPQILHIGVHIRRGDVSTLKETNIQQWKCRWVSDAYYLNALGDLRTLIGEMPFQVHIFSDGTEAELGAFHHVPHCVFHLHDDSKRSFHGLVSADILVSSSSAFSICAGKISSGVKLIGCDFDHDQFRLFVPETPDWVRLESTGHLSRRAEIEVREQLAHRGFASGLAARRMQNA